MPERNNEYVYQPPAKFTEELRQRINNAGFSDEFKQQIKSAQKEEGRKMFERRRHNMNEIERTIRDLQLYVDVKWGGTNDMLNLALTALKDFCKLQQENEQLQAQVARMREAIQEFADTANILTGSNESIIAEGSTYWKFKQVLSDTPADYHNPSDVELLRKARKALHKGISELKVHCKYFDQTPEEDACIEMHEAVVEIDKAIGGGGV